MYSLSIVFCPPVCLSFRLFMVNFNIGLLTFLQKRKKKEKEKSYETRNLSLGLRKHWYLSNISDFLSQSLHAHTTLGACALPQRGGLRTFKIPGAMPAGALADAPGRSNQPERFLGEGPEEACIPVLQARFFFFFLLRVNSRNWKKKSCYGNSKEDINCVRWPSSVFRDLYEWQ